MKFKLIILFFTFHFLLFTVYCFAQDGKEIFNRDCNACHTVGNGPKVGPDLKDVTKIRKIDWLSKFINSSAELIAAKDPDAVAIFEQFHNIPMPPHTLTPAEIKALLNYIDNPNQTKTEGQANVKPLFTPDPIKGKKLFIGNLKLEHGGPSCISCHSIRLDSVYSGGTLANDLSTAYYVNIVDSMISSLPAMKCSYKNHEVTFTEKSNIEAFLQYVKENQAYSYPKQSNSFLVLWGTIVSLIFLLISLLLKKFIIKTINKKLRTTNNEQRTTN